MDLTPYLQQQPKTLNDEPLLSVAMTGKIALAMKGRFFLRCFCESLTERAQVGCAVTDEESCLNYLKQDTFEFLLCTDLLERGNGFELVRKAREHQPDLKVVVLALSDAIPVEYDSAPWLEAVVAEADIIEQAISKVLDNGLRTADIMQSGMTKVGTEEMGKAIAAEIEAATA